MPSRNLCIPSANVIWSEQRYKLAENMRKPTSSREASQEIEYKLDESLGFMMTMTERRLKPLLKACVAYEGGGLSYGMWFFLRMLWEEDGLTQKQLAERVGMMQPTAVIALRSMERSGFVEIKPDPDDGRTTRIFLTQTGRQVIKRMLPMLRQVNEFALQGITPAEFNALRRVLRKIRQNIDNEPFVIKGGRR